MRTAFSATLAPCRCTPRASKPVEFSMHIPRPSSKIGGNFQMVRLNSRCGGCRRRIEVVSALAMACDQMIKWKKLVEFRRSELPAGSVGDVNSPSRLKQHAGLCHCKHRVAPRRLNDLAIF